MFSRRHPYLFFILTGSAIWAAFVLGLSFLFWAGKLGSDIKFGEKVGVIEITGAIVDARETLENLDAFRRDDAIKAIVVRIDSPGGSVGPSQEIFREIKKTTKVKKVIVSMGSVAASGGYYAAVGSNGIMANPGTITGSIGVIIGFTNFKMLMDKIGLYPMVVKSGEFKDVGSPMREMTEKEKAYLQSLVDQIHQQFVADVAQGRHIELEKVAKLADGRIYTGAQAKELGLVDRLGNFTDAVAWAGEMAGIKGEPVTVWAPDKKSDLIDLIMGSSLRRWLQNISHADLRAESLL